jgi:SPP1 gp7 family putative phage head morphogenesis protein
VSNVLEAVRELEQMQNSKTIELANALADLTRAAIKSDREKFEKSQQNLSTLIAEAQSQSNMLGRRRLILEAQAVSGERIYSLMRVPFTEAIETLIRRVPALAQTYEQVQELYKAGSFALARAASLNVTKHIQKTIAQAAQTGVTRDVVLNEIAETLGARNYDAAGASYVRSYADTVFRTTTTTAYTEGRIRQAQDPAVRRVIGAWRYDATLDGDVRPNHRAADDFVASIDDPVWETLKPPLGYNCRCALSLVSKREAAELGIILPSGAVVRRAAPVGAFRDAGFG